MNPAQCRAARALLLWTLDDLAKRADVTRNTIHLFEHGRSKPHKATVKALRAAFEEAGVEFLDNGSGLGLRLKPGHDN
ncbi:MAG: helix-turn-helix transcriptional regulator [Myxococcales bacterium]|nr:helix-turn-helix transcriptional regulator [Myxococcales bacterium]